MVTQVDTPAVSLICHRQINILQHIFPSQANCTDLEISTIGRAGKSQGLPFPCFLIGREPLAITLP